MAGPLDGVRVLEVASFISGPYAAMLLADLGAEVIKVEPPGTGDPFRGWGERQGGERPQFAAYNRGKKSVTLDLRNDLARRTYLALAKRADVVVENFRPGTAERMGIGDATLREANPRLVYCAMTGVGSSGPASHRPIYDAIGRPSRACGACSRTSTIPSRSARPCQTSSPCATPRTASSRRSRRGGGQGRGSGSR